MSYTKTQEDREWRCMALAIYLHRYLKRLGKLMSGQKIPVTLTNLAIYMEITLANEDNKKFAAWDFAVENCPRILRSLENNLGADGFNKVLANGEYIPVVLMVMTDALAEEPARRVLCVE